VSRSVLPDNRSVRMIVRTSPFFKVLALHTDRTAGTLTGPRKHWEYSAMEVL